MKHTAGKALDELIAETVMGWQWVTNFNGAEGWATNVAGIVGPGEAWEGFWATSNTPDFSTDIRDAWAVVERFTDVTVEKAGDDYEVTINGFATARAATAPLAICLAALEATE